MPGALPDESPSRGPQRWDRSPPPAGRGACEGVLLRGPKDEGTAPGDAGDSRAATKGHMQKPAGDWVLEGLSEQEPRESRDRRQLPHPGGLRAPSSEPLCQQGTWGPRAAAEL